MKNKLLIILTLCHLSLGAQWELRPLGHSYGTMNMWFRDAFTGYLVGEDEVVPGENNGGIILGTTDGGITWDTLYDPAGGSEYPAGIRFVDGFGITCNRITNLYKTTDYGATWSTIDFEGTDFLYEAIDIANPDVILIAGWSGEVFKITDEGNTIEKTFYLGTPYKSIKNLQCVGEDTCYFNNSSSIYMTVDAGDTWSLLYDGGDIFIDDLFVYPNNSMRWLQHLTGETELVFKSDDLGVTFDTIGVIEGFYGLNQDMDFAGATGYLVDYPYKIFHTIDSGKTWEMIMLDSLPDATGIMTDVQLINEFTGYIIGEGGLFYTLGSPFGTDVDSGSNMFLFPNPAGDFIEVINPSSDPVYIYTISGALIGQFTAYSNQINISQLAAGVYFVKQGKNIKQFVKK